MPILPLTIFLVFGTQRIPMTKYQSLPLAGEISMVAAAIRLSRTHFCSYVSRWSILSFWWCALVTLGLPAAIVIVFGYTSSSLALAGNVLLLISTDHRSKKSAENIGFRHLLGIFFLFLSWQH